MHSIRFRYHAWRGGTDADGAQKHRYGTSSAAHRYGPFVKELPPLWPSDLAPYTAIVKTPVDASELAEIDAVKAVLRAFYEARPASQISVSESGRTHILRVPARLLF